MEKTALLICALLVVLLCFSGCVVPAGSVQKGTIDKEVSTTTAPSETITRHIMTAEPVIISSTPVDMPIRSQPSVNLTIHSAQKQNKLYTIEPISGYIFLVMNITIKNNNLKDGYEFTEKSISLSSDNGETTDLFRTRFQRGKLRNPIFIPTTIQQNDTRTGEIVFFIPINSVKCQMYLYDNKGVEIISETLTV